MPGETFELEAVPRVVVAGNDTEVVIRPRGEPGRFREGAEYTVTIYPMEEIGQGGVRREQPLRLTARDGALHVRDPFPGEQEYLLHVEATDGVQQKPVGDCRIYALAADLHRCRPFKGDTHIHSCRSDGHEPPAQVAAACRRIGMDFMAVTDHWRYAPSLEASRAFEGVPLDLRIFPGEEVHHYPYNPVHIINFGGRFSVNALINPNEPSSQTGANQECTPTYLAEVQAIARDVPRAGLSEARHFQYAQCLWTYRKIREAGGLGVFCHPYWFECRWYNVPDPLITRHFAEQPYDAYELIGGYHRHEVESNLLQVARYHEERAAGRRLAIVGASDAHGCETGSLFGWYWTVVFAPSAELPDLIQAIKDYRSVAVEALPGGPARAHGPFRLVKFTHFLMREVFPAHDACCAEDGRLMDAHLRGDPAASSALGRCQGRVSELYNRLWGVTTA